MAWLWDNKAVTVGADVAGAGPEVLLLPALSSISTRSEMRRLQDALAPKFRVTAVDWPGFGDRPRPKIDWTPAALSAFLAHLLGDTPRPYAIVAAGHAAAYALHHIADHPEATDRLVLLAPTWRGPLPTMLGERRPWLGRIVAAVDAPVVGPLLYRLNVSRFVVDKMVAGHVYSDPAWLSGSRLAEKSKVTGAPGARFASVRFVTGALDRLESRDQFLGLARRLRMPALAVFGSETPKRSLAEMRALAALDTIEAAELPRGKLSVYEEFAPDVATRVREFLDRAA